MSKTVDSRVVEMRFDNKQFEAGVATSMSTLDKLKQKLNLTSSVKGLENINSAAKKVDFTGLSTGVESISAKFSSMQVIGVTALANITNSAVNAGKRISKALTIDPIITGFREYETQINAIQTILANTQHEGTTIDQVNDALDELNKYADQTIYNFTEMTRNIGTFTAAGVDLDTALSSIKGIANLAAVSGSSSQQASVAMYQLSQAIAAGKVQLMDWNSVVNAGMGGKLFQDALKRTAKHFGYNVDGMIKKYGSFRESLTQGGWLTTEVLTETLTQLSGAYTEADLIAQGYTEKQAKEIVELANTAVGAATDVKTFTQLIDTTKEALQSGWAQTWEIIFGDFEEAKALFSDVGNVLNDFITKSADSRNKMLEGWSDLGGRAALIDAVRNAFEGLASVIKPISEAFRDIFSRMTSERLYELTIGLKELTEKFKVSDQTADKLKRTFKGLFSIVDIFRKAIVIVGKAIGSLFGSGAVGGVLDLILSVTAAIGDFFTALNKGIDINPFTSAFHGIATVLSSLANGLSSFGDAISGLGSVLANILSGIFDGVKTILSWITDNISIGDIFAGLAGGGIFVFFKKLSGLIDSLKNKFDGGLLSGLFGKNSNEDAVKFRDVLSSVNDSLQSFTSGIKISSLVAIAAALAILSSALSTMADLDISSMTTGLFAMGVMFAMLTVSFKSINKALSAFVGKGMFRAGAMMLMLAKSIDILSVAIVRLSNLSFTEIAKGLIGIGGSLAILVGGLKAVDKVKIKVTTIVAMIALADSLEKIGESLIKLGAMSWGNVARGLSAMGGALLEFMIALKALDKISSSKSLLGSISLLIAVQSLDEIADSLSKLGAMSWSEIGRGLTAMGGALTLLGTAVTAIGKLSGIKGVIGAVTLVEGAKSLGDIAKALQIFGSMSFDEIKRGLVGMGGALTELGVITGLLGKLTGLKGLIGSIAIVEGAKALGDIANAFTKFVGLSWDEIKMGLVGMGGALAELGIISGLLGKLTGLSGILGSASILIAVQSLEDISLAFMRIGSLTWDEIKNGLIGMGGALAEVGIISGALGKLAGLSGIFGAGAIYIAVQGLEDIALAFSKFSSMSWADIGQGLVGMGGALAEVGAISTAIGYLNPIGAMVGAGSITLATKGLNDLAIAFQKFGSMSWDEVKRGLVSMGAALGELALGGIINTLSILGSFSIAKVAEPLGILADSVKKWANVTVPEDLSTNLSGLAKGVRSFTLSGFGAGALAEVAEPLGALASSVKKWAGVVVPENLYTNLSNLASGVKTFTFGGFGASALTEAAPGVGAMADSVKKWNGVVVPENISTNLSNLATGVKSFNWGGSGASAITEAAPGVGAMADAVRKWTGVVVPEGLSGQLYNLSEGVKSFRWKEGASENMSVAATGLNTMADAVIKWKDIVIPEDLPTQVESLSTAITSFEDIGDISDATDKFGSISTSISKLAGIDFSIINSGLNSLASSLKDFGGIGESISGIGSTISSNITKPLNNLKSTLKDIGAKLASSLASGLKSGNGVKNAATALANAASKAISSKNNTFKTIGTKLASNLSSGITSKKKDVKEAGESLSKNAAKGAKDGKDDMETAGKNLGSGLVIGINSKKQAAWNAGYALGKAAVAGEKAGQNSNSPSKDTIKAGGWLGEGLVIGMRKMFTSVKNVGYDMGQTSISSISRAISKVGDLVDSDLDIQPTISPVIDLSNVESGVGAINSMFGRTFGVGASVNLNAINTMMNRRIQNGVNDDVVSAINDLKKTISGSSGDSYNIDGITYDDGSNVADAVKSLVRAAKIERRI